MPRDWTLCGTKPGIVQLQCFTGFSHKSIEPDFGASGLPGIPLDSHIRTCCTPWVLIGRSNSWQNAQSRCSCDNRRLAQKYKPRCNVASPLLKTGLPFPCLPLTELGRLARVPSPTAHSASCACLAPVQLITLCSNPGMCSDWPTPFRRQIFGMVH